MNTEQLEDIYGPLYRHSDHKIGDTIRFCDAVTQQVYSGQIEWVQGPGEQIEGGRHFPVMYVVNCLDPSTGFPFEVPQKDVIV